MEPKIHIGNDRATRKPVQARLGDFWGRHCHCMGLPFSGKSVWLFSLVCQLARYVPVIVLDLKGDLYTLLLRHAVRQRLHRRTLIIDPYDAVSGVGRAPSLNLLDEPGDVGTVSSCVKAAFKRTFRVPAGEIMPWLDDSLLVAAGLLAAAPSPDEGDDNDKTPFWPFP